MLISSSSQGVFLEEFLIISGLIGVQVIYAVYLVFLNRILSIGLDPLFLVIFASLTTSFFLLPFAVALEKKKWPTRLSPTLMIQFVLIALGGVTTFQALMLLGIKKTSPAIASAMPNLAPGLIFMIAACLRFEKVDIRCMYSRAKIMGTLVCLSGAVAMSFLQSPPVSPKLKSEAEAVYKDWIIGCLYLLASVLIISCTMVLQAATMRDFPAPFTLCVVTSLLGAILTAVVQIIIHGKIVVGSPVIGVGSIIAIVLVGGVVTGACAVFQAWSVKKKGPVMVSMFNPIQTVCSTLISVLFLGQIINLGSLAGMFIMFGGLYIVLWAKKKEGCNILVDTEDEVKRPIDDVEKPLLS